jgi:hypothetical protein
MWETEAVEVGLDMSIAMSRASWLIGTDPAKGRQGSALQEKQDTLTWSGQSVLNKNIPQLLCSATYATRPMRT